MISEKLENLAFKIAELDSNWRAAVADLGDAELDVVLMRAEQIGRQTTAAAQGSEQLPELALDVAAYPSGFSVVPWRRGLIIGRMGPSEVEHD